MNGPDLAELVHGALVELCGEQFQAATDPDGDIHFALCVGGSPIGLVVEQLSADESLLAGFHIIGTRVEDNEAAARYVARRNQQLHVGRVVLCGGDVVFVHHLFASGVNRNALRNLLGLLASESRSHPDLAATTGALRLADVAALENFDDVGGDRDY